MAAKNPTAVRTRLRLAAEEAAATRKLRQRSSQTTKGPLKDGALGDNLLAAMTSANDAHIVTQLWLLVSDLLQWWLFAAVSLLPFDGGCWAAPRILGG